MGSNDTYAVWMNWVHFNSSTFVIRFLQQQGFFVESTCGILVMDDFKIVGSDPIVHQQVFQIYVQIGTYFKQKNSYYVIFYARLSSNYFHTKAFRKKDKQYTKYIQGRLVLFCTYSCIADTITKIRYCFKTDHIDTTISRKLF